MSRAPGIVVVGGGECGTRAAFELREAGWQGPVTLVGAEPGLPYERPPLSKSVLAGGPPVPACDEARLRDAGVRHVAGVAATDIDRERHELVLGDGRRVGYDRLLLATGAVPRRLAGLPGALQLRSLADALALRDRLRPGTRVGVVGAGLIGLEVAAGAVARGCAVTVVEAAPRPLARAVPAAVAEVVAARHAQAGVDLRCGVDGADGAETALTGCDVVVVGVGAVPETALAEKAGLAVSNGVLVDDRLRTSDPDVYAAGDCCAFPHPLYGGRRVRLESWRNAHDQAVVAARNLLGADEPYTAVPWFWSDQYDLTLQVAGLVDAAATEVVRTRADGVELRFGLEAGGRLVSAAGVGPGNAVAKDVRLAERLIAARAAPDPADLADAGVPLKALLRAAGPVRP
jgi:3-phenylpropionate/trans-cinnamate dioxygenase ferredoxin reductase subunit